MIQNILANNENIHINDKQIAILKEHFPSCFSADGSFDLVKFQEEIKDKTEVTNEGYELRFLGKSYAKLLASTDTTTVIVPDDEHNELPENKNSENLYISGDNLDGLKHLLNSYQNQVRCIYIDPPYNTGTDGFVYNDNFNYTVEELQDKLSIDETQAKRILDLSRRGSASHSAWLMFMYPRLLLARDLLTNDGVIFISIDNNEQSNLKVLCDEIFGEENFIENFMWTKTSTPPSLSTKSRKTTEYVLTYEKYKSSYKYNGDPLSGGSQPLLNSANNVRKLTFPKEFIKFNSSKFPNGTYDPYKKDKVSLVNKIIITDGVPNVDVILEGPFKWDEKNLINEIQLGTYFIIKSELLSIRFINNKDGFKRPKNYIAEEIVSPTINKKENEVGTNEEASSELREILGDKLFDFTKPVSLIKYLLNFLISDNDIVLDFFSGSGSTAHAVMQLNAEDQGTRKFIAVQLPEVLSENVDSQNAAYRFLKENKLPSTLDYVGIERIKRAALKIKEGNPDKVLDLGFKHFILKEPNQNTLDKCETFDKAALISDATILDDFGAATVLSTWLNNDGYGLSTKAQPIELAGYTAYYKDKHLYLIYPDFTQEALEALLTKYDTDASFNPENIILFGYSFSEWSVTEMLEKNLKILNDSEKNLKINYAVRY